MSAQYDKLGETKHCARVRGGVIAKFVCRLSKANDNNEGQKCLELMLKRPGYKTYGVSVETLKRYSRRIGPKMKAVLEELATNTKLNDVSEELEHIRAVHLHNCGIYSDVMESLDKFVGENAQQNRDSAMRIAGEILKTSAFDVLAAVEKMSRIEANLANQIGPNAIALLTRQMTRFVYEAFDNDTPEGKARIDNFEKMLNERLELPTLKATHTNITPDMQVRAMDSTVPYVDEPDDEDDE